MSQRAVGEVDRDEPAIRAETFEQPSVKTHDRPAQKSGCIDQMAAMGQDKVPPPIGLGIALGLERLRARHRDRLEVVGHRVSINRVIIPRLERDPLAHLLGDELAGEGDPGIETAIVAHLDDQLGRRRTIAELAARLDRRAQRFLDQDVLAGRERLQGGRHMELVGDGDDDRVDPRVGQHLVVVAIGQPWVDERRPCGRAGRRPGRRSRRARCSWPCDRLPDARTGRSVRSRARRFADSDRPWRSCDFPRIALPQGFERAARFFRLATAARAARCSSIEISLSSPERWISIACKHGIQADARVGLAALVLDGIDRGAGQEQDVLGDPLGLDILEVEDQVSLIESTRAGDHRGIDSGDRPRECLFRGEPFGSVGADDRASPAELGPSGGNRCRRAGPAGR